MYALDESGQRLVDIAAQIATDVARPSAAEVDEQARFPAESMRALGDRGFWGLTIPDACGGLEQPARVFAAVVECLARECASSAMVYVMHVAAMQAIAASTTLTRREEWLRQIAAGDHLTTLAFSERGSRSQFWAPVSQLQSSDGDGFVTSARKSWVTSAGHADSYVSSAQKAGADSPLESTLYLLDTQSEGVQVEAAFDGLGLRGNDSAPVSLDQLRVAADDLLTEPGAGAAMMLEVVLPWFAIGTAAMANGLCSAAVAATTEHLKSAGFETDGSRLCDLPNLRARLAQMNVCLDQSRALLAFSAAQLDEPNAMTPLYVLQARLAAINAALEVTDLAMKACGGAAFSKHLGIERMFRDARAGWVMAPTADHLQEFIGRALTGMPLF